ncbi:unnamed protein product [Camellia sinensis]
MVVHTSRDFRFLRVHNQEMASFSSLKSAIFDREERKQQYQAHIRGLNAYDRHKKFLNDYGNCASMECSNVGSGGLVDYTSQFITNEVFKSKEELLSWVRDVGRKNGFVIVIKTSDYGGGHRTLRIYLACERSGQYRAHKKLKGDDSNKKIVKITGTKKCGCPFELRARKLMADDDWMVDVACGMHNHAPAKHFEEHSFAGRLSEEETSLLVDMSKSMVRPKEILVTLKQKDALNVTTMKTIYIIGFYGNERSTEEKLPLKTDQDTLREGYR